MGNFNRDNRRSGSGGNRSFDGGSRGPKQMFDARCSECGEDCKIPFEPRNGRPVFCSDCFRNQDDSGSNSRGRDNFSRGRDRSRDRDSFRPKTESSVNYKNELSGIDDKLKQIIELLKINNTIKAPLKKEVDTTKKEKAVVKKEPKKTKKASAKTKKIVKKLKAKVKK